MEMLFKQALDIQITAQRKGFDWPDVHGVADKVREELGEVLEAIELPHPKSKITEEIGDLLFSAISLARHLDIDPDIALQTAIEKFSSRFKIIETALEEGKQYTPDALETLWNKAKEELP